MNKKIVTILSVLIIIIFIGYIIYDVSKPESIEEDNSANMNSGIPDTWKISQEIKINEGELKAVTATSSGVIYTGGETFVSCYGNDLKLRWDVKTKSPVSALSNYGDSVFAATEGQIMVISTAGEILNEWGPYEDKCFITSISSNRKYVAFADARNKIIFILDKGGEVKKMIGQNDREFVIPSPYFDVDLNRNDSLFTANTGRHRIETRTIDGQIKGYFGEPGTAPGSFCGCCAPAHFAVIPQGFVTAEKGINRIKILDKKGGFVEFVNSRNNFVRSVPLDLASADGQTIYAANPSDSKLYVFIRK
jgi:hypothetical protein